MSKEDNITFFLQDTIVEDLEEGESTNGLNSVFDL